MVKLKSYEELEKVVKGELPEDIKRCPECEKLVRNLKLHLRYKHNYK